MTKAAPNLTIRVEKFEKGVCVYCGKPVIRKSGMQWSHEDGRQVCR